MFISFEGTEGAGKSTLVQTLAAELKNKGHAVVVTREPGGCQTSEQIRELLLSSPMQPSTELLLMFAARAEHVAQTVEPALNQGAVVLCDRFVDASVAYQGYGRGLSVDVIQSLADQFVPCMPALTFWLDLPVEEGMKRAKKRGELDRFESQELDFFNRVRAGYQALQQKNPHRMKRLEASKPADQLLAQALELLIEAGLKL